MGSFFSLQQREIAKLIEDELRKTKELVKAYRIHQQKLVDDNIVDLLEKTAQLAFKKTLSLKDHTDLVIQSLEEAKQAGLFNE